MTDTDTTVNYSRTFISRVCMTCSVTFDLDPASHKRKNCYSCSPATTRPVLPPPAAELRVEWSAEREARGASPTAGTPRCTTAGCPVRWSGPPSRPCPDHAADSDDETPLGTADPRLAALPDAPVLTPAERAARRARLAQANEQLLRDRAPGFHVPKDPPQPRPAARVRAGVAAASCTVYPATLIVVPRFPACRPGCPACLRLASRSPAPRKPAAAAAVAGPRPQPLRTCRLDHLDPGWGPGPRLSPASARAWLELLADHERPDTVIAGLSGASRTHVRRFRGQLEQLGAISVHRPAGKPAGTKRLSARALLAADPALPNWRVAELTGLHRKEVPRVRRDLGLPDGRPGVPRRAG